MEEIILKALKMRGFNYITRDMDGTLIAWKRKPIRYTGCPIGEEERRTRSLDGRIDAYSFEQAGIEQFGTIKAYCGLEGIFLRSEKDMEQQFREYGDFMLCNANGLFKNITWDNSPFEIPETKNK